MTLTNDIEIVNQEIRKMQFSRLIVFADVVNRYAEIILKNKTSWLQTNALKFIITRGGSLTPSQLATIMLRSNYSITKIIDNLEKEGLVKRTRNGKDRRSLNIEVTLKGMRYVESNLKLTETAEADLKSWLSESELTELAGLIRKLRDKLIEKIAENKLSVEDKKVIFGRVNQGGG
jgi:DNA-binding MarR family transcriptional regulator